MAAKVLIYEDNESLRESMVTLLEWEESLEVVGAMSDASFVKKDLLRYKAGCDHYGHRNAS